MLAAAVAGSAEPVLPPDPEPVLRVRLYDYVQVRPATLAGAQAAASEILGRAGIRLQWAECRLSQDAPPKDPACKLPLTPMDLQLRLLNPDMAGRIGATRHCLGYAWLTGGYTSVAAAFFHRAVELEKRNLADRPASLGAMMAHEIGHLLLEKSAHSESGIMRAVWGDEDLKMIAKGRMSFTAEQARRIESMIAKREEASRRAKASYKSEQ